VIDEAARVLATAHAALDAALRRHASTPVATGETFTLDGAQRP
jgi:hypothetical protein